MADGLELLAATVGGGILTLIGNEVLAALRRPRLDFSIGSDPLFQVRTPMRSGGGSGIAGVYAADVQAVFLRVLIQNKGRKTARNCRVFLTSIERTSDDGSRAGTGSRGEALALTFSFRGDEKTIDLPAGVPQFVDVMMTRSNVTPGKLELAFGGQPLRFEPLFAVPGRFAVRITAVADGASPVHLNATFIWNGGWDSLRWNT
jgi:hypothetical protein